MNRSNLCQSQINAQEDFRFVSGRFQNKTVHHRQEDLPYHGRPVIERAYANDNYAEMPSIIKSKLAELLLLIAEEEQHIEHRRQRLAALPDFEPYSAYSRLDRLNRGFITGQQLRDFLAENGHAYVLESQCTLVVKYFSSEEADCRGIRPNAMSYQDFMQLALPSCNAGLRAAACQRPPLRTCSTMRLHPAVENEMAGLLATEIEFQNRLEDIKQDLQYLKFFNVHEAFCAMDPIQNRAIDERGLRRFLKRIGHEPKKPELLAILRRMDQDGDGCVSFLEFREAVCPVQVDVIPHAMIPRPVCVGEIRHVSPPRYVLPAPLIHEAPVLIRAESPRPVNHISRDTNIAQHYAMSSPKRNRRAMSASYSYQQKNNTKQRRARKQNVGHRATFSFAQERPQTGNDIRHNYESSKYSSPVKSILRSSNKKDRRFESPARVSQQADLYQVSDGVRVGEMRVLDDCSGQQRSLKKLSPMRESRGPIVVVDECNVPVVSYLGYNTHSPDRTGSQRKTQQKFERSLRKSSSPQRNSMSPKRAWEGSIDPYCRAMPQTHCRPMTTNYTSPAKNKKLRASDRTVEGRLFRELCNTWESQIALEKEIESLKCSLAERRDFTCMAAYSVFDYRNVGCMTMEEFSDCLFSYVGHQSCDNRLGVYVFLRHDADLDGRINYGEFCRLLVPKTNTVLSARLLDRCVPQDRFSHETQELFRRLLIAHCNLEKGNNKLQKSLCAKVRREGWALRDLFELVDENHCGHLTDCALECFLIEHRRGGSRSLVTDTELLISLYERQQNGARAISLLMFEDQLTPKYLA